jgi:hypothetical protein
VDSEKISVNPCPLLIGYLSLKQGAGAKTGTDGRTFYLWYDKDIWLGYVLEKP